MTYNYVFTRKAEEELNSIVYYLKYVLSNEKAASDFIDKMHNKIILICNYPRASARIHNRFINTNDIRKVFIKGYVLYYLIIKDTQTIYILTIRHTLEDQDRIIKDLLKI